MQRASALSPFPLLQELAVCDQGCHPVLKHQAEGVPKMQRETTEILKRERRSRRNWARDPKTYLLKKKKKTTKSRGVKFCLGNREGFAEQVVINLGLEEGTERIQPLGRASAQAEAPTRGYAMVDTVWTVGAHRQAADLEGEWAGGDPGTLCSQVQPSSSSKGDPVSA